MLANEGVQKVFGIIDGTYFGLYSSLKKFGIDLISPRHEACALHVAGAYARLMGKPGVAIASNGPGVANALAGVAVENGEAIAFCSSPARGAPASAIPIAAARINISIRPALLERWRNGAASRLHLIGFKR